MTDETTFEARLEARLVARASAASRPFDAAAIARAAAVTGGAQRRLARRLPWLGAPAFRPLVLVLLSFLVLGFLAVAGVMYLLRPH